EGIPAATHHGYEIFDDTNLGMSEFVQKLNFRRALEGELSRTITELDEVESARVHIVIPEPALFREKENPPTASVAVKLRSTLGAQQVAGIEHLIASAVEGLDRENVTIVDSQGNVLSRLQDRDPLMALTATQIELKQAVEHNLGVKVKSMLEELLGPNKAIVRVAADLDFSRSEVTKEEFDPEATAVRSEESLETVKQTTDNVQPNPEQGQPPLEESDNITETNNITNFEVSKTTSHIVTQAGGLKRISASVMIDGTYQTVTDQDGNESTQYVGRTQEEVDQITQAVRTALGFDQQRGDEVTVINVPFHVPEVEEGPGGFVYWIQTYWYELLKNIVLGAAVIGVLIYLRNLLQKSSDAAKAMMERRLAAMPGTRGALPGASGEGGQPLALPDIDSELPDEVLEQQQLQQRITDFVLEQPETAARLLKTWLVS
ncbi:flagellar M-ring protein FliF, partial [bacterium]|nr:flagellar M-ring protein FliF [bacterium]